MQYCQVTPSDLLHTVSPEVYNYKLALFIHVCGWCLSVLLPTNRAPRVIKLRLVLTADY